MSYSISKSIIGLLFTAATASLALSGCSNKSLKSLVPDKPSDAPDYMCTWNLQGYYVSYDMAQSGGDLTRNAMNEENLFGNGKYQNWAALYPKIHQDLFFVMDDSWDIPKDANSIHNNQHLGTVILDSERFPSFTGSPTERLKQLCQRFKEIGWKGVGGWICAQKAGRFENIEEKEYWIERLKMANEAGFSYWKVDWGHNDRNDQWRRMITNLGKEHAPDLWIEHAMKNEYITFSDVFRTYDVEDIIAQPVTIQRICDLLPYITDNGAKGIINCEDEPYIAVALGCAIGIMRHPFNGYLPNGKQDFVFPPVGRDYKNRLDEVVRSVRWHRIAQPFAVNADCLIDTLKLHDFWEVHEHETYVDRPIGSVVQESAPARVSRRMPLPEVADTTANRPYVLASCYPNGAVAVAAIGRTLGREYVSHRVPVTVSALKPSDPIGIFGSFKSVTIKYAVPFPANFRVIAQDLAGDKSVDITNKVTVQDNALTITGNIIDLVGLMSATPGDKSEAGMVMVIK